MRPLVLLLALATAASAQAPPADTLAAPADRARALIAADEKDEANRVVNRALDDAPDDPELLTLRLQLQQDGVGLFGRPPFMRRQIRARTARRLLRADPDNPHAHSELGKQGLEDYLFDRDFIRVEADFDGLAALGPSRARRGGIRPGQAERFRTGGRYDLRRLRVTYPYTERPGMEEALAETRAHLQAAVESGGGAFADALTTLLVFDRDHAATLALADSLGDDGLRGAALYRLGRIADADDAFRAFVAAMSRAERQSLDDPRRIRPTFAIRDVERFWASQDVRLLTAPNERRIEHRARVVEADALFGTRGTPGRDTPRGRIYVRYGAPSDRATFSQPFYPGDTFGPEELTSPHYEVWEYETGLRYVFSDPAWSGEYAVYSPSAVAFGASPRASADDYVAQDERLQRDLPDLSQYLPPTPLPLAMVVTAFRGENGATDLVVASGVQAPDGLAPSDPRVHSGAYVLREGLREAGREDSTASASPVVALPSGAVWARAAQLSVQPGEVTVRAEIAGDEGRAAGWEAEIVQVPTWPTGLALSGLLLAHSLDEGRAPNAGEVSRGGTVIQPAPRAAFASGDPVGVYAEVYGLDAGAGVARYAVEAALVPVDGRSGVVRAIGSLFGRGRRRGVSVEVQETAPGPDASVALLLDASRQPAGDYTLTLTVTDLATEARVEASRELRLE